MAREVNAVLATIIAEHRGITEQKAEDVVKSMRSANQYQVCLSIFYGSRWPGHARAGGSHRRGQPGSNLAIHPTYLVSKQKANITTGGRLVIEPSLPAPGLAFRDKRVRGEARQTDGYQ